MWRGYVIWGLGVSLRNVKSATHAYEKKSVDGQRKCFDNIVDLVQCLIGGEFHRK